MYCKKCGVELEEGSLFCKACGTKTTEEVLETLNNEQTVEKHKGLVIAGFVCALVGIFVVPILGLFGIIFGAIGISGNPVKNKIRSFSIAAIILGIIDIAWIFLNVIFQLT